MDGWDQVLGLCATKYPGKPFEGQENECTNQCLSKPPWQAMPLPHIRRQRFFHHLRIQHQVDDRVPTDGGFGKEQAGNLWYIYKSQDRSLEKTLENMTWHCNKSFCINQESRKYRCNGVRPIRGQDNYQTRNLKMTVTV